MTYGGVTDSYGYDTASRLTRIASSQVGTFTWAYDDAGRRMQLTRPNGVTTSYGYDNANGRHGERAREGRYLRLTSRATPTMPPVAARSSANSNGDHAYGYDPAGRVISTDNPSGQVDETSVMTIWATARAPGSSMTRQPHPVTHRIHVPLRQGGRITDRIATGGATTRFTWDSQSRLRKITLPDGSMTTIKIRPTWRRICHVERDPDTRPRRMAWTPMPWPRIRWCIDGGTRSAWATTLSAGDEHGPGHPRTLNRTRTRA